MKKLKIFLSMILICVFMLGGTVLLTGCFGNNKLAIKECIIKTSNELLNTQKTIQLKLETQEQGGVSLLAAGLSTIKDENTLNILTLMNEANSYLYMYEYLISFIDLNEDYLNDQVYYYDNYKFKSTLETDSAKLFINGHDDYSIKISLTFDANANPKSLTTFKINENTDNFVNLELYNIDFEQKEFIYNRIYANTDSSVILNFIDDFAKGMTFDEIIEALSISNVFSIESAKIEYSTSVNGVKYIAPNHNGDEEYFDDLENLFNDNSQILGFSIDDMKLTQESSSKELEYIGSIVTYGERKSEAHYVGNELMYIYRNREELLNEIQLIKDLVNDSNIKGYINQAIEYLVTTRLYNGEAGPLRFSIQWGSGSDESGTDTAIYYSFSVKQGLNYYGVMYTKDSPSVEIVYCGDITEHIKIK